MSYSYFLSISYTSSNIFPQSNKTSPQGGMSVQETSIVGLNIFVNYHLHTQHYIKHWGIVKKNSWFWLIS